MEAVILEIAEQVRIVWLVSGASEFPSDTRKDLRGETECLFKDKSLRDQIFSCS